MGIFRFLCWFPREQQEIPNRIHEKIVHCSKSCYVCNDSCGRYSNCDCKSNLHLACYKKLLNKTKCTICHQNIKGKPKLILSKKELSFINKNIYTIINNYSDITLYRLSCMYGLKSFFTYLLVYKDDEDGFLNLIHERQRHLLKILLDKSTNIDVSILQNVDDLLAIEFINSVFLELPEAVPSS